MKRRELLFTAGKPLPQRLRELLSGLFDPRDIEILEREGGRLVLSLTTPSPSSRSVDRFFVSELEYLSFSPDKILEIIKGLSTRELKKLAGFTNIPFDPDRVDAVRGELVRYFLDPQRFRTRIEET